MLGGEDNPNPSWVQGLTQSLTAIGVTVIAAILLGFLGTVKDLWESAPLIADHMQRTNEKLSVIDDQQQALKRLLAVMDKDYTPREVMREELKKIEKEIASLQLRLIVLEKLQGNQGGR